jgi:hypothetical protein
LYPCDECAVKSVAWISGRDSARATIAAPTIRSTGAQQRRRPARTVSSLAFVDTIFDRLALLAATDTAMLAVEQYVSRAPADATERLRARPRIRAVQ